MPGPADTATEPIDDVRIREILSRWWGFETLRPLQADAIRAGLAGHDSLVVMPTGGGKSLCYQLPPLVNETTDVVVSPLVALMKDQVDALEAIGYPAAALHSGLSPDERRQIRDRLAAGELRLLFTAPERLVNSDLLDLLAQVGVKRFAIDEAHCISQWGHDFRPEYRQLALLRERFPSASIHAFTATATPRVRDDIVNQLQLREPEVLIGIFDRPNLVYRVVPRTDRIAQTLQVLGRHANVGGMHWKGWNAIKNEAVGHSSLDLTYDLVRANPNPTPETLLQLLKNKQYYTEGLVGNRIQRFTLPLQK